jgi:hypothetical protein
LGCHIVSPLAKASINIFPSIRIPLVLGTKLSDGCAFANPSQRCLYFFETVFLGQAASDPFRFCKNRFLSERTGISTQVFAKNQKKAKHDSCACAHKMAMRTFFKPVGVVSNPCALCHVVIDIIFPRLKGCHPAIDDSPNGQNSVTESSSSITEGKAEGHSRDDIIEVSHQRRNNPC